MSLQVQAAVKNGQRFMKHRVMRAAAAFKSKFKPPVGTIDYKRFEKTKTFQIMKEMAEKRGIVVSANPRSQCRNDRLYVSTSTILCLQHDYDAGKIVGMELLHRIKHMIDEYDRVRILDNAKVGHVIGNVK